MRRPWRRLALILPGLLVLAGLVGLRLADPAPVSALRLQGFDLFQRLAPRPYDPDVPVRVVAIDDESLRRLGQWPWPRDRLARLVDRLGQAGAAAVALDLVLAEPDRSAPARIAELLAGRADPAELAALTKDLPDPDRELASALGRVPSVVAFAPADAPGRLPRIKASFAEIGPARQRLDVSAAAVPSLPEFEAAAAGNGSIGAPAGRDEVLRRLPAVALLGDALIPSLAVEALRVAQGAGTVTLRAAPDGPGLDAVRVGEAIVPVAPDGQFWLRFTADVPARQVPAWQLLEPVTPSPDPAAALRGRIMLIGVTATGFGDTVLTPLRDRIAGVTAHAEALEQILLGQALTRPAWATAAEVGLLLALGLALVASWRRLPAIASGGLVVLAAAAIVAGAFLAYRQAGLLLDPTLPALGLLLTHGAVAATAQWRVERERRAIRTAFAQYLAPSLVTRLTEHPERLRLGGEWREMSFVFTDIAGFTSLSESVPPDRLVATLRAGGRRHHRQDGGRRAARDVRRAAGPAGPCRPRHRLRPGGPPLQHRIRRRPPGRGHALRRDPDRRHHRRRRGRQFRQPAPFRLHRLQRGGEPGGAAGECQQGAGHAALRRRRHGQGLPGPGVPAGGAAAAARRRRADRGHDPRRVVPRPRRGLCRGLCGAAPGRVRGGGAVRGAGCRVSRGPVGTAADPPAGGRGDGRRDCDRLRPGCRLSAGAAGGS
ncbi:MAG: CHASE2 domain-containing protein [Inquilinus limosus]|uniref:CHASE2 domain-containing protein n=1 Tax=Inquilinus limosus TaxID=171674 RepID=A0A952FNG2_9PROT|nr:CHASE2 domain-containing protein [Inquilinus limosus]